jgi:hypothetical protein
LGKFSKNKPGEEITVKEFQPMQQKPRNIHPPFWPIITIGGIVLFSILYLIAAKYYPGGSNFNPQEKGFSLYNNYWCELLGENAKNGQSNVARPIALTAMVILAFSISLFWIKLPDFIPMRIWPSRTLQISGVLSMFSAIFIYSSYHDFSVYISVIFGTFAFIVSLYGLYTHHYRAYFNFCILCVVLIQANNFIYLSTILIDYLPLLQKITFIIVFIWIVGISLRFMKK